ncbi:cell division protein ZapE [Arboricoccus pini]|uniref:Cell division protein ZapE n=1 Tax=Arboricoccus pini TaxID=1963835 RepID=A0A212Q9N9_9PROT|nr:cell division protein ZapE [Arboricoccus pini]SNB56000.1 cell division protein ZapE [Arboricoccus pini]
MTIVEEVRRRVEKGDLLADAQQMAAAERLDALVEALATVAQEPAPASGGGWLKRLVGGRPSPSPSAPRGLYIHGDVGRGKSMLMDLFFAAADVKASRRVHFHEFMLEVQRRLTALRGKEGEQPLQRLAREIAKEARLLCFDEFHVVNIADAMILARLFEGLFAAGVVVVATSNWPPQRLYENGLNRDRFLPFIDLLLSKVDVLSLNGPFDYRLEKIPDLPIFVSPLDAAAAGKIEEIFAKLADGKPAAPLQLPVGGRVLDVARAAGAVAAFEFKELCDRPLGAADYLALTERFAAIVIENVPLLSPARRNEARRLMTLVDALYERKVVLVMSMAAAPAELYLEGEGAFEFERTVSRLMEMQSSDYLQAAQRRHPDALPKAFIPFALTSDVV